MGGIAKGSLGLPFVVFAPLLAVAVGLGGCASGDDTIQQELTQLRQDLNALTLAVNRNRTDTETGARQLDRRTRDQAAESARQITATSTRLEGTSAELNRLSARVDELSLRVDALTRQLAARAAGPAPPGSPAPPAVTPAPDRSAADGTSAEQAYQAAYLDFNKGSYALAITGFKEMLRRFPDSALADKAQYWIGESHWSLARAAADAGRSEEATRQFEQAVQEFRRVVLNYPRGEKVPTALYKEALALIELRQTPLARARLQYLLDNFPQSEEAPLAKERLAGLAG
jgi:tol-pal system protein YbgF